MGWSCFLNVGFYVVWFWGSGRKDLFICVLNSRYVLILIFLVVFNEFFRNVVLFLVGIINFMYLGLFFSVLGKRRYSRGINT